MGESSSSNRSHGPAIILVSVLVILGGLFAAQRFFTPKPVRPAAWDVANPKSTAPFSQPDFGGGPEIQFSPNPETVDKKFYAEAEANDSASRSKFRDAVAKFTTSPPAIPLLTAPSTWNALEDAYYAYRLRELEAYERLTTDPPEVKQAGVAFLKSYITHSVATAANDDRPSPTGEGIARGAGNLLEQPADQ
jgi:hypothetical protein